MSEEAFHIMTQMDLEGAETQAVLQCAPLLTGIKMSNLLHVREGQQREVASMFEATPVSSRILYKKNGRISVFLYREQRLKRFLSVGKGAEAFGFLWIQGHGASGDPVQAFGTVSAPIWTEGVESPTRSASFWDIRPRMCPASSKTEEKISSVPATGRSIRIPPGPEGSLTDTTGPGRQPSVWREMGPGSGTL